MDTLVDAAFCISLSENSSRRDILEKEWRKINVIPKYFLVDRHPENPEKGCFESHVRVCKNALKSGYKTVLVFEDDVRFLKNATNRTRRNVQYFMENCKNWDILYFGLIVERMWLSRHLGVAHCYGDGAHAYLVSRSGMEKIVSMKNDMPYDVVLKNTLKAAYCLFPMIAIQAPEDKVGSAIADFRGHDYVKDERYWNRIVRKSFRYVFLKYLINGIVCRFLDRSKFMVQ